MYDQIVVLILGLVALCVGADFLIKGAKNIAEHYGFSHFFIGLTLVSVGTSIPEIGVSIMGGVQRLAGVETSGIVVGDAIGSALSQITLLLGILAFLVPLKLRKKFVIKNGAFLIGSVLLVFGLAADGFLSQTEGLIMLFAYAGYYAFLWKTNHVLKPGPKLELGSWQNIVYVLFGIGLVWISSDIVVRTGVSLANVLNIPQSIIGIFLIGVGTGLPELSVALASCRYKLMKISMGNLIGSNICDLLFSLGVGTVISGFIVDPMNIWFDIPVLFGVSALSLYMFYNNRRISRKEGVLLISLFVVYGFVRIFLTG